MTHGIVVAIVVTFRPNVERLRNLACSLLAQCDHVIVADNGGGAVTVRDMERLTVIDLGANLGIGVAINAGISAAKLLRATYVITFDQDSAPANNMVKVLVENFQSLHKLNVMIGGVGPQFIDTRHLPPLTHPFMRLGLFGPGHCYCSRTGKSELIKADTLITSGFLTSMQVWDAVGGPNELLFVDYTDIEWCFRARHFGYELHGVCDAQMNHELGDGSSRRFFGINLFEYSAVRRYYYVRNTLLVSDLHYVPVRWKIRLLLGMVARSLTLPWAPRVSPRGFWKELRLMLKGWWHGLRNVAGAIDAPTKFR